MPLPGYQPFYLEDLDQLRAEIQRLGLALEVQGDTSPLAEEPQIGELRAPNRFCALPLEGRDAEPDGSPGPLTRRRYLRLAEGGFGLVWIEATAVSAGARSHPAQLQLHEQNVEFFARWVAELRAAAREKRQQDVLLILQLAHAGRRAGHADAEEGPLVSNEELERLPATYAQAAALALEAGFDGVDVCGCTPDLVSELLASFNRPGPFGGSFEGRSRLLLETVAAIRQQVPDLVLASRLNMYHAVRHPLGFGVDETDYRRPDPAEPLRLAQELRTAGISLLGVTAASPNLQGPTSLRSAQPLSDAEPPDEHSLTVLARHVDFARRLRAGIAGLSIVGCGYTWLRQFLPPVAAGAVRGGAVDLVGMGRSALAYPDAPADILGRGRMTPGRCCMVCFACNRMFDDGGPVGCVIRDHEVYGPEYRRQRRFDPDHLVEEARRCHQCEAAPCTTACPTHIDIPAFLRAFEQGNLLDAYEMIRRRDPLPEMTSLLSPSWLESEGACIETTLTGRPIPILDIQYTVARHAREQGASGLCLSEPVTGKRIAVVGGGPAGLAGAIRLLEQGHAVELLEKGRQLGGTPQRLIPAARFPGAGPEVDAILQPALVARRLRLRFGEELGRTVALEELRVEFDAVLLAAGVWQEPSLGRADGVKGALPFLERTKREGWRSQPRRVAVLAGGDTAMDAAMTARALGAADVFVVYEGSRADMHWHLPDAWFATPGIHALVLCRPIRYETDRRGKLTGVRVCRMEPRSSEVPGSHRNIPVPESESVLEVDLAIEAMGLEVADMLRDALPGISFGDRGLIRTGNGMPFNTGLDNVFVAGALMNGGASVARCVAEGMAAASEMDRCLR